MEESEPRQIVLKTSRIYFLGNYIIAALVTIFIFLLIFNFNITFTLFPTSQSELVSTAVILAIAAIGVAMIEQPEWERFRTQIFVTMNEVIKYEGILRKERVILPYATVADIRIEKSILGRILNYGNLSVSSFKAGSDMVMKGIRNPDRIHTTIQNRVNLIREGQLRMFGGEKTEKIAVSSKDELEKEKEDIQEAQKDIERKYFKREIDETSFKKIMDDYEKRLTEINIKLRKLRR